MVGWEQVIFSIREKLLVLRGRLAQLVTTQPYYRPRALKLHVQLAPDLRAAAPDAIRQPSQYDCQHGGVWTSAFGELRRR